MQDNAAFAFQSLTPDLILDSLESIGVRADSGLLPLNSFENRVYQFHTEQDDGTITRLVTKFYRPNRWTDEQIQEEHNFALELAENEVPMVAPLQIDGASLHHFGDHRFTLYPCRGGRLFENDNLDHLEWMGRFIGRIHTVGASKPFQCRPTIDTQSYLLESQQTLQHNELLPTELHKPFFTILDQVIDQTLSLYQWQGDSIRLHGDCHAGNILWTDNGPHFVDLDDARMGPAIQDLWMMLSGDRHNQQLQIETMIEGYQEFADFDPVQLKLIEPLRAMRMIHYMAWIARRWQDPAFPRNFSWFAENKYWEQQILALKEQSSELNEAPLRLLNGL